MSRLGPGTPCLEGLRLGDCWNFEFLREVKIFFISFGELSFLWVGHFIFRRGRSVYSQSIFSSHFKMQDFKNSKKFLPLAPSFSIFTFLDLRQMQGFMYILALTLNLNFLFQGAVSFSRSSFFSPLSGHSKPTMKPSNHETAFFFIHLVGLKCSPNHPVNSQSILCECKQTWQLLVKIKSDLFVNNVVYNLKESFEKESAESLFLTYEPLN